MGELRRAPHERMAFAEGTAGAGVQAVILAREPRLELPVAGEDGCTVEVELSWPPSPEYLRVLDRLRDTSGAGTGAGPEWIAERDRLAALLDERLRLLQETERAWAEAVADRDRLGVLLDERLRLLQDTERAEQEAVRERDRAVQLLDERLALLRELQQRIAKLERR